MGETLPPCCVYDFNLIDICMINIFMIFDDIERFMIFDFIDFIDLKQSISPSWLLSVTKTGIC